MFEQFISNQLTNLMGNYVNNPENDNGEESSKEWSSESLNDEIISPNSAITIIDNPLHRGNPPVQSNIQPNTTTIRLALTENGDKAYSTTGSKCLDFFTRITRSATIPDYIPSFFECITEDYDVAFKILFNLRDIRGGKGEKLIPIVLMVCLKNTLEPAIYKLILEKYLEYGCWKDLLRIMEINNRVHLELDSTKTVANMDNRIECQMFAEQLIKDFTLVQNPPSEKKVAISLCAKWAPSEKTHFNQQPICASDQIRKLMGYGPKRYRQLLSQLRNHLNILERLMSTGQVDLIDFSKIPSVAMMKMKKAFNRDTNAKGEKSEARSTLNQSYQSYLKSLKEGTTKVNVKGIQPHELVNTYLRKHDIEIDDLVEAQWKSLVEKVKESGTFKNTIAIVDTSGSMIGQPMEVAISIGILVAECSECAEQKIITFSSNPRWNYLAGSNLKEKIVSMDYSDWGQSTNMQKVFELILDEAITSNLSPSQMVNTIVIFTDMQFDAVCGYGSEKWESTFEHAKSLFESHGYELPKIVCWNLRTSSSKSLPVTKDSEGYVMLSGFSSELLKHILNGESFTPYSMMLHVLEPYETVIKENSIELANRPFNLDQISKAVSKSAFKKAYKGQTTTKVTTHKKI